MIYDFKGFVAINEKKKYDLDDTAYAIEYIVDDVTTDEKEHAWLCQKMRDLYANSEHFRKSVDKAKTRDTMEAFVKHWQQVYQGKIKEK